MSAPPPVPPFPPVLREPIPAYVPPVTPLGAPGAMYPGHSMISGPRPPRVWPVFATFGILLAVSLGIGIVLGIAIVLAKMATTPGWRPLPDEINAEFTRPIVFVPIVLASSLTILCAALIPARLSPVPFRLRLGLTPSALPLWTWPLLLLAGPAIGNLFEELMRLTSWQSSSLENFTRVFTSASTVGVLFYLIPIALIGPVAEELFFRGYAQTRLSARWGALAGVAVASVLFGIVHLDPLHSLFAAAFGFYLGLLSHRAGSIWPAVGVHVFNNAFSTIMAHLQIEVTTPAARLILAGVSVFLIAAAVLLTLWVTRRRPADAPATPAAGYGGNGFPAHNGSNTAA